MQKRIVILATKDGPYSYLVLKTLLQRQIKLFGVALDGKGVGENAIKIWNERTAGKIHIGDIQEFETKNCPFFTFDRHSDDAFEEFVTKNNINVLVNAGTPNILKENILNAPNIGVLNVHPSLLPKYRGCTTMEWSIYNDDPIGNTAHFMSVGIDEGPIIKQESCHLNKNDLYQDARSKLYIANAKLMADTLEKIIRENITPGSLNPQPEGQYWKVMPPEKIEAVKQKLANGQYKYQQ